MSTEAIKMVPTSSYWRCFPTFNPSNWYGFCVKKLFPKYYNYNLFQKAVYWTHLLKSTDRMGLEEASTNPTLKEARKFGRIIPKEYETDSVMEAFLKEMVAAKLGISSNVFEQNGGFYEYARKNYLENYLKHFNHTLKVENGEVIILCDGKEMVWSEAKKILSEKKDKQTDLPEDKRPSWPWLYGERGVQNRDFYSTEAAEPYLHQDPSEWGNQHIFVLCACCEGYAQFIGNHSFFRIHTAKGEIYSEGLYRPGKPNPFSDSIDAPFRIKPGQIQEPDVTEFWPCKIHTLAFKINDEQLNKILESVNHDRTMDVEEFQIFNRNCTVWALKHAALGGFEHAESASVIEVLLATRIGRIVFPIFLQKGIRFAAKPLPNIVKKICLYPLTVAANIFLLLLGAGRVDKTLRCKIEKKMQEDIGSSTSQNERTFEARLKPHISSWKDVFRVSTAEMYHPYTLIFTTFEKIKKWRESEIQKLEQEKAWLLPDKETEETQKRLTEIEQQIQFEIPYALPPKSLIIK